MTNTVMELKAQNGEEETVMPTVTCVFILVWKYSQVEIFT